MASAQSQLKEYKRKRDFHKTSEPAGKSSRRRSAKKGLAFVVQKHDASHLLAYLGTQRVILTGIAGNICVLFTANDAYMRDLGLVVPRNCVASNTQAENDFALCQMEGILKANTSESTALDLAATGSRELE